MMISRPSRRRGVIVPGPGGAPMVIGGASGSSDRASDWHVLLAYAAIMLGGTGLFMLACVIGASCE